MQNYLFVSLGAAMGGSLRYWMSNVVHKILPATLPYGTLSVNILGSFIIGFVMYYLDANKMISPEMKALITTGFCGGLTTFSTFSFETLNLFHDSEFFLAGANILLNITLTLAAVYAAYVFAKILIGG